MTTIVVYSRGTEVTHVMFNISLFGTNMMLGIFCANPVGEKRPSC